MDRTSNARRNAYEELMMFFRQLFDPETSTYTYLLADEQSREAVLIDSVREQVARDIEIVEQLGLKVTHALETHVHADHVTGAGLLRDRLGCRIVVGERSGVRTADLLIHQGDAILFGHHALEVRETPGHTDGCVSFVCHEAGMAFTGDALLIRGCGRTDFQQGDPKKLYDSVWSQILMLPDDTLIYPGHDYKGRTVSTVGEEKRWNPRLGDTHDIDDFVALMGKLDLAYPRRIDEAVPANMASGVTEPEPAEPSTTELDDWAPVLRTPKDVPVLPAEWLAEHLRDVHLVDVRESVEFCGSLGHLGGSELVPLADLEERASHWDPIRAVVTVCTYGTRSGKAAVILEERGFERVASLHGGLTRWTELGLPVVDVMGESGSQEATTFLGLGI
jgi:glyoxylase-like metal-dependent hydrolase (beta-lactamase superfamily II)/rhodanese-related sulfurtransferase